MVLPGWTWAVMIGNMSATAGHILILKNQSDTTMKQRPMALDESNSTFVQVTFDPLTGAPIRQQFWNPKAHAHLHTCTTKDVQVCSLEEVGTGPCPPEPPSSASSFLVLALLKARVLWHANHRTLSIHIRAQNPEWRCRTATTSFSGIRNRPTSPGSPKPNSPRTSKQCFDHSLSGKVGASSFTMHHMTSSVTHHLRGELESSEASRNASRSRETCDSREQLPSSFMATWAYKKTLTAASICSSSLSTFHVVLPSAAGFHDSNSVVNTSGSVGICRSLAQIFTATFRTPSLASGLASCSVATKGLPLASTFGQTSKSPACGCTSTPSRSKAVQPPADEGTSVRYSRPCDGRRQCAPEKAAGSLTWESHRFWRCCKNSKTRILKTLSSCVCSPSFMWEIVGTLPLPWPVATRWPRSWSCGSVSSAIQSTCCSNVSPTREYSTNRNGSKRASSRPSSEATLARSCCSIFPWGTSPRERLRKGVWCSYSPNSISSMASGRLRKPGRGDATQERLCIIEMAKHLYHLGSAKG